MRNILSNYYKTSTLISLIYLIFGLLLFINPMSVIMTISFIIGVIVLLFGLFNLTIYYKLHTSITLISGLFLMIIGMILIIDADLLATIIPMMIGITMIIKGIKKIQMVDNFNEPDRFKIIYVFVTVILNLVLGFILVINPILGTIVTTRMFGILIIIYSIISIVEDITFKDKIQKNIKIIEEVK